MTPRCEIQAAGTIELLFYGELAPPERRTAERHMEGCGDCRATFEDLGAIRSALAARSPVTAPAGGNWSAFMARLDNATGMRAEHGRLPGLAAGGRASRSVSAIGATTTVSAIGTTTSVTASGKTKARWSRAAWIPTAALLALTTIGVAFSARSSPTVPPRVTAPPPVESPTAADVAGFEALSEQHFERSKLVVLGLAAKDPQRTAPSEWRYERELAASLLTDTRMYRLAAEDRGVRPIACVMRDLELVLIQTSCSDVRDHSSLAGIQRLIRKRDLVEKMDAVATPKL
jgi:hypothetical protein